MSVNKSYRDTVQKLKKRIEELKNKEEQSRHQLQRALVEARKLAKSCQSKLKSSIHHVKHKEAFSQAADFAHAVIAMEQNLLKQAEKRVKEIVAVVMEMDKQYLSGVVNTLSAKLSKKKKAPRKVKPKAKKKAKR